MKRLRYNKMLLRTAAISAWLLVCTLTLAPTGVLVTDAFAQPTPEPKTKVVAEPPVKTEAPKVETKGTVTVTDTKKDEAKKEEPKADEKKEEIKKDEPAAAPTGEKEQAWWQAVLVPVLGVLGLFIAGFLAAGLRKLVQLIEKKWNIDIPDSIEKLMIEKARWAIGWAEEQAEKRLLYGDGKKTPGAEKAASVINLLEEFANKQGFGEEWQRDKIEKLAEGVLHLERDVTVGSNGGARGEKLAEKAAENGNG